MVGPPRGKSPFPGRASRARFTVSVSAAAAITPWASGREASLATSSSISSGVTSGRAASCTATSSVSTRWSARATDSERLAPPGTATAPPPSSALAPGGSATITRPTVSDCAKAPSDHSIRGLPRREAKAFGPPAPSRAPEPAAAMTAEATGRSGRCLGPEALLQQLVQVCLCPVLVLAERVHELRREDLLRPRVHLLLAGGETLLPLADRQVPDHLGQLEDVPRLDLLAVVLEPAVPVLRHLRDLAGQHGDHLLDLLPVDHPAQARPMGVLARNHHGHVVVQDLYRQVVPLFAEEILGLLHLHDPSPVMRINDVVTDAEFALDGAELVSDLDRFLGS